MMQQAARPQGMIKSRTINLACSFSFNWIIRFQIQVFDIKQSRLGYMETLILTGGFNQGFNLESFNQLINFSYESILATVLCDQIQISITNQGFGFRSIKASNFDFNMIKFNLNQH